MKCRLKVKVTKKRWKLGMVIYNSYDEAEVRQKELKDKCNIDSIIVDEFGGKIK